MNCLNILDVIHRTHLFVGFGLHIHEQMSRQTTLMQFVSWKMSIHGVSSYKREETVKGGSRRRSSRDTTVDLVV